MFRFTPILGLFGLTLSATQALASTDLGHSHNDYEQPRALEDALAYRLGSVEADIWLRGGEFRIGHMPWDDKGSLEALYLDPLQRLVDRQGSVYGDGRPFTLWIDIKSPGSGVPAALRRVLDAYPMLTIYSDDGVRPGPVSIALTGNERNKAEMVAPPFRRASRDDGEFSSADPMADLRWNWYAIKWSKVSGWKGQGTMPAADRARFRQLVRDIHAKGRRVRFYAAPETDSFWREAVEAGVDLINADQIAELARFLSALESR